MIREGWYDRDFVRTWTNGPLLARGDNGRLLRSRDLPGGGEAAHYLAWDAVAGGLAPYDATTGTHSAGTDRLALDGRYDVVTLEGKVTCRPVFALYAELCARHTPEAVEATCWIPPAQLHATARLIRESRPTAYYAWSGHEQHANVTQTARAMSLLYALTGSFDAPGGNVVMPRAPFAVITGEELPAARRLAPALGATDRPLGPARWNHITAQELYRGILEKEPYPVRTLVGFGTNILLSHADGRRGRDALASLDFFAHADLFMTPTAALADIVLPVASAFEREALKPGFELSAAAQNRVQLRPAVVPPPGEARSDTRIVFDLACRLGLGEHFWRGDIDAALAHQLAPAGIAVEALRAQPAGIQLEMPKRFAKHADTATHGGPVGFDTPSRRIEFYSEPFLEHGYAPLPEFVEPSVGPVTQPELAKRFPLVLTCAKPSVFLQSQHRAIGSLRRQSPGPKIDLHPEAAGTRGIAQGDWVAIDTPDGQVRARAHFNASLDPRVVVGEHGWWQACAALDAPGFDPFGPEGANLNLVTARGPTDPVSGTPSHRAYLCEVRKA